MTKNIESYLGAVLLLGGLLLFLTGMVLRLIGSQYSGGWVAEITIYLVAWGLLISAAGCVAYGEHIRADFFIRMLGPGLRLSADILASISGLSFCFAMAWFGWEISSFALLWDERGPSFLQIPTVWYYAALPFSMLLCSLRYVFEILSHFQFSKHKE
jgi:TRAP-type C4-dicarboxylate transport system permease small subunit